MSNLSLISISSRYIINKVRYILVLCKSCETYFCEDCANLWLEKANSFSDCPICRGNGVSEYLQENNYNPLGLFYSEKVPKLFLNILSKV